MRPRALSFVALIVLVVSATSACTSESQRSVSVEEARAFIGNWRAEDTTRFVFGEEGEALWIFGDDADEDTFQIQYDYTPNVEPAHLDLSGFDRGFLRGRTLYCIVAFDSVSVFRLDCEPGKAADEDVRPDTFTQKTMTYRAISTE